MVHRGQVRLKVTATTVTGASVRRASDARPKISSAWLSSPSCRAKAHRCMSASARGRVEVVVERRGELRRLALVAASRRQRERVAEKVCTLAVACAIVSTENSMGLRQCPVIRKSRNALAPHSSRTWRMVVTFPSDLDIFSPVNWSIPLWAQTGRRPRTRLGRSARAPGPAGSKDGGLDRARAAGRPGAERGR